MYQALSVSCSSISNIWNVKCVVFRLPATEEELWLVRDVLGYRQHDVIHVFMSYMAQSKSQHYQMEGGEGSEEIDAGIK